MIGKKINQLATELAPASTDLTIIGNPTTGVSKKITLAQLGAIFSGAVSFYTNYAAFPTPGTTDVIYCAKDTQKLYLWSGSAYVEVFPSQALLDTYQLRSEKGNANGYASLDSSGKVPVSQLPSSIMEYKGTWSAATNTPTLANGTGDTGDVYICNAAGSVDFGAGPITFAVGDYVIYSGSIWQRSSGAVGTVTSVAASITGNAIGITGSPVTTSGTLAFAFAGTGAQYIKGDGTLATFPSTISQAEKLITEVYNSTGATLTKGTVVYINGGQGNLPTVTKALATGDSTSAQTFGIVQADITNNNNGYVVVAGKLNDLDTQAYTEGTQLYLSSTTAGAWTSTKQYAPAHLVYVGIVVRSHPTQGIVEVKIQNGYELDEIHNVAAQTPTNNDGLFWEASTSLWKNKSIATVLGYTPQAQLNGTGFVKASGTTITYDNSTYLTTSAAATTYLPMVLSSTAKSIELNGQTFDVSSVAGSYTSGRLIVTPTFTAIGYQSSGVFKGLQIATDGTANFFNTGLTRFYNQVQFDGTLTNGTYTYTLPGATGTLALTSDIPSLSGYVPYTGATTNLNLGSNNLTAAAITGSSARITTLAGSVYADVNGNLGTTAGTQNTIAYWGSQYSLASLSTTTYPDLTELSYVKGVTSSIQTQLNSKQSTLTNPVTGTGTTNYLPKFTGASTIGNSNVTDTGSLITLGSNSFVNGSLAIGSNTINVNTLLQINGSISTSTLLQMSGNSNQNQIAQVNNANTGTSAQASYQLSIDSGIASFNVYSAAFATAALQSSALLSSGGMTGGLILNTSVSAPIRFRINAVERMRLDASGNLGLGVTPSAWYSSASVLQVSGAALEGRTTVTQLWCNGYVDTGASGNFYINTGYASKYTQISGQHQWWNAPSGTAGNAISFTQAMTLNASGNLSIGNTNNAYKLDVSGQSVIRANATNGIAFQGIATDGNSAIYFRPNYSGYNLISSNYLSAGPYLPLSLSARENTSDLLLNASGNVSIGNTNDTYKLDVSGTGRFSSSVTATQGIFRNSGVPAIQVIRDLNVVSVGTAGQGIEFGALNGSTPTAGAAIYGTLDNPATTGALVFQTLTAGSLTTKLTLASTGAATFSSSTGLITAFDTSNANGGYLVIRQSAADKFYIGARGVVSGDGGTGYDLYAATGNDIRIFAGGTKALTLATTGAATFSSTVEAARYLANSSSASLVAFGVSAGNGMYNAGTDVVAFSTASTERMRISSGGNVGIGTTSPVCKLHVNSSSVGLIANITDGIAETLQISTGSGYVSFLNPNSGVIAFRDSTNSTERMRITSGGSLLVGTTSELQSATSKLNIAGDFYNANGVSLKTTNGGSGSQFVGFINESGTLIGSINRVTTTNAVAYNTTSDYRLKEDLKSINGLEIVNKIKVYDYKWKADNSRMDGVLAHELAEVLPYAVTGIKDGEKMQQVDYSKIVPVLIQSVKELKAELDTLKNK